MNLQCPNCQKALTVGDQFAGKLMKCPLCNGTFTVPSLPPAAGPGPVLTSPVPPPPGSAGVKPPPAGDTYSFKSPPVHVEPQRVEPLPDEPTAPRKERRAKEASAPLTPPAGYEHAAALQLNSTILQYVVVACLVLVFVLQFFNWVGVYAGSIAIGTQNAWQAAFGGLSINSALEGATPISKEDQPGFSVLMFFYLFLFILALLLAIASLVVTFVPLNVPAIEPFLPWRWAAVGGLSLLALLLLVLQLVVGFSLEHKATEGLDKQYGLGEKVEVPAAQRQQMELARAMQLSLLHRTGWLRLALALQIIGTISAGLLVWLHHRGNRSLPRLELHW